MNTEMNPDLLKMTAEIVAAHVSNNSVPLSDLPAIIRTTYDALANAGAPKAAPPPEEARPAVPIRKSVAAEHIVCLECGQKLKMLKRHLKADHDMSPEDYRARWRLPAEYPMVAPNYAKARSDMAVKIGLGRKR